MCMLILNFILHNSTIGEDVPAAVGRALKMTKCRHKSQAVSKQPGAQSTFFHDLWERIHSETFNGADGPGLQMLLAKLDTIVPREQITRELEAIPNAVSYDDADFQVSSPDNAIVTEEDFSIALELLRRPPTPNNAKLFDEAPYVDITPAPVNQVAVMSPIESKISSSGERTDNDLFVVSKNDKVFNMHMKISNQKKGAKKRKRDLDDGRTRKFSR